MTPDEHAVEAEELLSKAVDMLEIYRDGRDDSSVSSRAEALALQGVLLQRAQGHALLSLRGNA